MASGQKRQTRSESLFGVPLHSVPFSSPEQDGCELLYRRLCRFLTAKRTCLCERTFLKAYGSSLACCCFSRKTKKLKQNRTTVATSSADRKLKAFARWVATRTQCRPFARAREKQNSEVCETASDFLEALRKPKQKRRGGCRCN